MKDPSDDIRDWLYTTLNGHVSYGGNNVPVYSFPPENVSYPYILLGEQSGEGEQGSKESWLWDVANEVTIYHRYNYPVVTASYVPVNTIASTVMQLVRTFTTGNNYATDESPVALANFSLVRVRMGSFNTSREEQETGILISKQLVINILVQED